MCVFDDEARDNNNNKYQENGEALIDLSSDDGGVLINLSQINGVDIVGGYNFHGGCIMDSARLNFCQVDNGGRYLRDRPLVDLSYWNLANSGNGNIDGSSKIYPGSFFPYYSSNYDPDAFIHSFIGYPKGEGVPLFYSFIQTLYILTSGADDTSSDNDAFEVKIFI